MRRPGFTLIELLIVLVIIGIIVTVAIPNYERYIRGAQAAEAKTVVRKLADACVHFYMESGRWPTEEEGLAVLNIQPPQSQYFDYTYGIMAGPTLERIGVGAQYKDTGPLQNGEIDRYIIELYNQPTHFGKRGQPVADGWYRYYFCRKKGSASLYDWDGNRITFL